MESKDIKNLLIGIYDLIDENARLRNQSEQLLRDLKPVSNQEKKTSAEDELYALAEEEIKDIAWPHLITDLVTSLSSVWIREKDNFTIVSFEEFLNNIVDTYNYTSIGRHLIRMISYPIFIKIFHKQLLQLYNDTVSKATEIINSSQDDEDEEENENDSDGDNTDNE